MWQQRSAQSDGPIEDASQCVHAATDVEAACERDRHADTTAERFVVLLLLLPAAARVTTGPCDSRRCVDSTGASSSRQQYGSRLQDDSRCCSGPIA